MRDRTLIILALGGFSTALLLTIVIVLLPQPPRRSPMSPFLKDLIERAIKTFVQAFLATIVAGSGLDIDTGKKALVAGAAAALSVISSVLSSRFGAKNSASLLPPPPPPA